MPAKKGKGKKEAAGRSDAETARLILLRAQEAEAESFLRCENERRQRDEVEERFAFLRDEQVRALREKDNRLDEVTQQLKRVTVAKEADDAAHELQIQELRGVQDVLRKKEDLSKVEMEELRELVLKERASTALQLGQLRETLEAERRSHSDDRQHLRERACEALAEAEVLRHRLQRVSEEKEFQARSHSLQQREVERDLEKAVATSAAMREALAERDADGRKNTTLLQLLNAQLEADARQHENEMSAEQECAERAKADLDRLACMCSAAQEEIVKVKREAQEAKQSAATEVHELKLLVDQIRFDAEYLHRELDTAKAEHHDAAAKAEQVAQRLRAELHKTQVELEAAAKENGEMKALLLRKEREHFDTVTFLNAQVSNGRTTIAQLREELKGLRDHYEKDLEHSEATKQRAAHELEAQIHAEKGRNEARHAYEQTLLAEIETLKSSAAELQAQLTSRGEALDQLRSTKNDEIARLRDILDAHFIPNRQEVGVARESARADEVFLLKGELRTLEEKSLQREKARQETEALLRSRIADQMKIIAALQLDVKQSQLGGSESVRTLEEEVGRLQKTLEVHRITGT